MSKVLMLRCLVNERLTAAAEEIFALFERTIAEYEEELCRSKEENQRKQHILDSVLSPQVLLHSHGVQFQTQSSFLEQEKAESPAIELKSSETPSTRKEEELLQDFTSVVVKSDSEEDIDDDEETPTTASTQQNYSQVYVTNSDQSISTCQISASSCQTIITNDSPKGQDKKMRKRRNNYECTFCEKKFRDKHNLNRHTVVHTGEKPFSCPVCAKCFTLKSNLTRHLNVHAQ